MSNVLLILLLYLLSYQFVLCLSVGSGLVKLAYFAAFLGHLDKMNSSLTACFILLCVASSVFSEDAIRFACNVGKFGPTAATREKLGACHNSTEYGNEEGKKNPKCAAFCFTEAIRGLKDGVPDKAAFDQLIEMEFPEKQKATAKEQLAACFEKNGKVDLKDEKCVDIAAFSACATSIVTKTPC